jgi:hypothetical protein
MHFTTDLASMAGATRDADDDRFDHSRTRKEQL